MRASIWASVAGVSVAVMSTIVEPLLATTPWLFFPPRSDWGTRLNYPDALTNTDSTIDQLFMSPHEHVGWNDLYFDSQRTPGAVNHLDPDPNLGYLRAVTGDLAMTTATWRSGAGQIVPAADASL